MNRKRHYWIVKHGFDALTALPDFIWRTGERRVPNILKRVKRGDCWIGFAYTSSDMREKPLSQVVCFRECTKEVRYAYISPKGRIGHRYKRAWMVEGVEDGGWQPETPVGVPPIDELLGRRTFRQSTLIPIGREEYEQIRRETKRRQLNPKRIPIFGREPRYEQEVLAIVACAHKQLGIERIDRIRTAFPDMTVKLRGRADPVHLELEVYSKSFETHGHLKVVDANGEFQERNGLSDPQPVGLLCWVNDLKTESLKRRNIPVFELQELLRERKCISWRKHKARK